MTSLENEIQTERQKLDDADGGRHAETRKAADDKKTALEEAKQRQREHENEFSNLDAQRARAIEACEASQVPIKAKKLEIEEASRRLDTLRRDRGKQQSAYGPNVQRLLSAIRANTDFIEKPVGPIGQHVRLLKPMWSSILEKQFGGMLDTFIVTSKADQNRLRQLMQSHSR